MKHTLHILTGENSDGHFMIEDADMHIFFLHNYSGKLHVEIQKEQAQVYIFGIYIGRKQDDFKITTIQDHQKGSSMSDLFIRGVFFDDAKFLYEGLINIAKDAQKSNAYQKNQNLLLSKHAFVDSRPFLEILANDVRCTHGSTTGRIDKEQMEYLNSRGIAQPQAQKLIVEGFIEEVFQRLQALDMSRDLSEIKKKVVEYS